MESVVCLFVLLIICWFLYTVGGFSCRRTRIVGLVYAAIALLNVLELTMEWNRRIYAMRKIENNRRIYLKHFSYSSLVLLYFSRGVLWLLAFYNARAWNRDQARYLLVHDWYSFVILLLLYLLLNFDL